MSLILYYFTSSFISKETYYKIKSEIEQQLEKPDKPPVWSLRKNPPSDFHNYLQMSEEEEENYMKSLKHNFVEEE